MINEDIAKDIVTYVISKASISNDNIKLGFLTGQYINSLPLEEMREAMNTMQSMIVPYVQAITDNLDNCPSDHVCVRMFQYIFDRSFEICYNLFVGKKPETIFNPAETGDYYELDVPEYIQLKINKVVPKVVMVFKSSYNYIEEKGYINEDCLAWIFPLLVGACGIALRFAMEMDLNDDSEMRQYLKND